MALTVVSDLAIIYRDHQVPRFHATWRRLESASLGYSLAAVGAQQRMILPAPHLRSTWCVPPVSQLGATWMWTVA